MAKSSIATQFIMQFDGASYQTRSEIADVLAKGASKPWLSQIQIKTQARHTHALLLSLACSRRLPTLTLLVHPCGEV